MNQDLTIIFFDDYFVSTILPNENAWETLKVNSVDKQSLYFYVKNNAVRNDDFAIERFEANDPDSYGNFYSIITDDSKKFRLFDLELPAIKLLQESIEQMKVAYSDRIGDFTQAVNVHEKIAVNVCFIPGISEKSQQVIVDFLAADGFRVTKVNYFEAILDILFRKRVIPEKINLSIVESYFGDLWLHYIEFDRRLTKHESECLVGKGVDYRIGNLAKLIVRKAAQKSSSQILYNELQLEEEIKKFHRRASSEINNFLYGELDLTVELSDFHRARVMIDMRELEKMSSESFQFIKFKYESFISRHSNLARTEKIFLNGTALSSDVFIDFFEKTFGASKIIKPFDNFIELLSRGIFSVTKPSSDTPQTDTIEISIRVTQRPPVPPPAPGSKESDSSKTKKTTSAPPPPTVPSSSKPGVPATPSSNKPPVPSKKTPTPPPVPPIAKPQEANLLSAENLPTKASNGNGHINGSSPNKKPPPPPPPPLPKKK